VARRPATLAALFAALLTLGAGPPPVPPLVPPLVPQNGTSGIIYTESLAFSLTAPDGWVLDNHSGRPRGLAAVLYPQSSSWKDAAAVMYPTSARKPASAHPVEDVIAQTLDQYRAASPGLAVEILEPTATADRQTPELRKLSGGREGNVEAVAFIEEADRVVLLVLSARSAADFASSLPAFRQLIASYTYLSDKVLLPRDGRRGLTAS
jgi:hypothetical protein